MTNSKFNLLKSHVLTVVADKNYTADTLFSSFIRELDSKYLVYAGDLNEGHLYTFILKSHSGFISVIFQGYDGLYALDKIYNCNLAW